MSGPHLKWILNVLKEKVDVDIDVEARVKHYPNSKGEYRWYLNTKQTFPVLQQYEGMDIKTMRRKWDHYDKQRDSLLKASKKANVQNM